MAHPRWGVLGRCWVVEAAYIVPVFFIDTLSGGGDLGLGWGGGRAVVINPRPGLLMNLSFEGVTINLLTHGKVKEAGVVD
jgi:hypothetical protein